VKRGSKHKKERGKGVFVGQEKKGKVAWPPSGKRPVPGTGKSLDVKGTEKECSVPENQKMGPWA